MQTQDVLVQLQTNHRKQPALKSVVADIEVLSWTFAQLQQEAKYCLHMLQACGAVSGDSVLLLAHDLPHIVAILFACLDLNLTLIPLHPDHEDSMLESVFKECQPKFIILEGQLLQLQKITTLKCPGHILLLRNISQNWLSKNPNPIAHIRPWHATDAGRSNAAIIFHSSGTTGQAKALHYSRSQLVTFLYWQQLLFNNFQDQPNSSTGLVPSPRINTLPLVHWGGLSFCLQALLQQRCVYLLQGFAASELLPLVRRSGCQLLMLIPAMYRELLPLLQQKAATGVLRYCLTMGEAMSPGLSKALYANSGIKLYTAYGMSEALCGLAHGDEPWEQIPEGSCGRLAFGEIRLMDEQGQPVTDEGELWIRNATTTPCYRDAVLLQEKYTQGWYRTGDRMQRDAQGYYFFRGRTDGMCVHNGRNVYPQQLEAVFIAHAAVTACIAAPLITRAGLQRLAILLVHKDCNATAQNAESVASLKTDLMDFYLEHGALYAAPVFILLQQSLPCNLSGKPDRRLAATLLQQAYDTEQKPVVTEPVKMQVYARTGR